VFASSQRQIYHSFIKLFDHNYKMPLKAQDALQDTRGTEVRNKASELSVDVKQENHLEEKNLNLNYQNKQLNLEIVSFSFLS
jgi:hypothetical protein